MNTRKYLSLAGKIAGFVSALNVIPFVDPKIGVVVFAAASILKDSVNRIGDLLDDGKPNQSFKS
jgi:hypothetical protein